MLVDEPRLSVLDILRSTFAVPFIYALTGPFARAAPQHLRLAGMNVHNPQRVRYLGLSPPLREVALDLISDALPQRALSTTFIPHLSCIVEKDVGPIAERIRRPRQHRLSTTIHPKLIARYLKNDWRQSLWICHRFISSQEDGEFRSQFEHAAPRCRAGTLALGKQGTSLIFSFESLIPSELHSDSLLTGWKHPASTNASQLEQPGVT